MDLETVNATTIMMRWPSRPLAPDRSPARHGRWRAGARMLAIVLVLCAVLASPAGWGWNPYRTDSGWSAPVPNAWRARDEADVADRDWRRPARGRTRSTGSGPLPADRYQFRHDPKLDAQQAGQPQGWQFRPRSERERSRSVADHRRYPHIDERDYLPQAPWRSYQDEGAAFGYHADDPWSGGSTQPWLR